MNEVSFGDLGYEAFNPFELPQEHQSPKIPLLGGKGGPKPSDNFMMFRLGGTENPITDLTEVAPDIAGDQNEPDVHVSLSMMAFHIANSFVKSIDATSRATLRLDLGKDKSSNSPLEPLFWSVAAGLDLYEHVRSGSNSDKPKEMSDNFTETFRRRPVEIPGGLGQLRLEVIAHPEKPWWRKALSGIGQDQNLKKIVSSVGFPGIALDAVKLIDEMIGQFESNSATPIIQSRPLTLAFSEAAKSDYTGDLDAVRIGCVSPGYYVLLKGHDAKQLRDDPPLFLGHTGHLVSKSVWGGDKGNVEKSSAPYADITYAVVRIRARGTKLGGL
ncbi:MAG: hypothetical protein AAFX81_13470 [Pseudomonadota bacterium]